jgi:hypothetical protein
MNKGRKSEYINNTFIFILLIYLGQATEFVRSIQTWENIFGLVFLIIITLLFASYHKVSIKKSLIYLIVGYSIYIILISIKFQVFHPRFTGIYLLAFYVTYITIKALRYRFFLIFEKVLVQLCKISLVLWVLYNIFPINFGFFMDLFSFSEPGAGNVRSNIIFYTLNSYNIYEQVAFKIGNLTINRNAGFSWEPGGFSVMINLGMFINLIRSNFSLKNNKNFWILLLALLSTFSTTGYGIFMLLVLFYFYNNKSKYKGLLVPIVFAIGIYLLSLPFMIAKLVKYSNKDLDAEVESSIFYGGHKTPQRINSFIIDYRDFKNNPFLGYGGHQEERWTNKLDADIATISGIGKIFAVFGLVGVIFFFTLLYKSSKLLSVYYNFKGWGFPFSMILMISISYSLIFNSLLMCFWMHALFMPRIKPIIYSSISRHELVK